MHSLPPLTPIHNNLRMLRHAMDFSEELSRKIIQIMESYENGFGMFVKENAVCHTGRMM